MAVSTAGSIDHAVVLDDNGLFLDGWLGEAAVGADLRLRGAPRGGEPVDPTYRFRRLDLEDLGYAGGPHGFACLVEAPGEARRTPNLKLEIVVGGAAKASLPIPDPVLDPAAGRRHVLGLLELGQPDDAFLARHVYPAIERLRSTREGGLELAGEREFGAVPREPETSIIIPVGESLDPVASQVALLAKDADLHEAEILLVVDSAEREARLAELAHHLHRLYGLPMRALGLTAGVGPARATNLAAAHAAGELLLLLHPEVLPERPGWLRTLTTAFREGGVVAAGPKLLFEDRSIRQAGLSFERDATGGWRPVHLYAGMPSSLPGANEARRVPALTRGGLLVTRSDFTEVGGFDTAYASATYEDSDLSLRLQASGRTCRYVPEAELYDLEDQSPSSDQTGRVAYDRWLFNHRWSAGVADLIDEPGADRPVGRAVSGDSR